MAFKILKPVLPKAKAFAPATVANIGPGFDVLGLALEFFGDEVTATPSSTPGIALAEVECTFPGVQKESLSSDPRDNTAVIAAEAFLEHMGYSGGVTLSLKKNLPLGSGLGSSAASAVASVVAINALFGSTYSKEALLPFTIEAERRACGSAHADNVAPSLLGGIILLTEQHPPRITSLPVPSWLHLAVVTPRIEVKTKDARAVLPSEIPLSLMVKQSGHLAGLIAALCLSDRSLLTHSLKDVVVEPYRKALVPGFDRVVHAAHEAGALGTSLSGSGPSIFACADSLESAERIGRAMKEQFALLDMESHLLISPVNRTGAQPI